MSIHFVTKSARYKVDSQAVVTVRVVIGEAQAGGWVIAWDAEHIVAKGEDPTIVELGLGKDLAGRVLQIMCTAVDVRSETNRLSSTLAIAGGANGPQKLLSTWEDGSNGDAAVFTTMIGFE